MFYLNIPTFVNMINQLVSLTSKPNFPVKFSLFPLSLKGFLIRLVSLPVFIQTNTGAMIPKFSIWSPLIPANPN